MPVQDKGVLQLVQKPHPERISLARPQQQRRNTIH